MSFLCEDGLMSDPGLDDDDAKKSGDEGTGFCDCDCDCELDPELAGARLRTGDSDMVKKKKR